MPEVIASTVGKLMAIHPGLRIAFSIDGLHEQHDRTRGIPGAFHCPRGLLEFWIDPESPYHHAIFAEPKEFVFFCNLGWRSALAADIAQQMGLKTCHIDGGFEAWKAFGGEIAEGKK